MRSIQRTFNTEFARSLTFIWLFSCFILYSCGSSTGTSSQAASPQGPVALKIVQNEEEGTLSIFRDNKKEPILVQNAKEGIRPYIHPMVVPNGETVLTQYSPGHHMHQTGLYWGLTSVNGRDYFHNPQGDYWRKIAANILEPEGDVVKWQTIYQLLDEGGNAVMEETQNWSMQLIDGKYLLDMEWQGEAKTAVVIGKYDYGGLFLRMPWKEGIAGEIVTASRKKNEHAEGQPAVWANVGMEIEGQEEWANVAIFDHPENRGYPNKWRVDGQLGLGLSYTRDGDWALEKGKTETLKHQLVVYSGKLNDVEMSATWSQFSGKEGMYSVTELWALAQQEGRNAKFLPPKKQSSR